MIKKTTSKQTQQEGPASEEDYYQEIIATRGAPEAAHLLADSCRKKDAEIKKLKSLIFKCRNVIATAIISEDGFDGDEEDEGEALLMAIDSALS